MNPVEKTNLKVLPALPEVVLRAVVCSQQAASPSTAGTKPAASRSWPGCWHLLGPQHCRHWVSSGSGWHWPITQLLTWAWGTKEIWEKLWL